MIWRVEQTQLELDVGDWGAGEALVWPSYVLLACFLVTATPSKCFRLVSGMSTAAIISAKLAANAFSWPLWI